MLHVIAYDLGTTGVKTGLISVGETVELVADAYQGYDLYILENGGAEQDADQWWSAMCETTRNLMKKSPVPPEKIDGISFCSQMQGLVLVDKEGNALRRPMSYMDQRARKEMKDCQGHGIQIAGVNVRMLMKSLRATHAASTSVKDPLWKYKWVQQNEPEIYVWRRSGASSGTDRVHGYRRETYCKGRLRAGAFPGDLRIWRGW